MANRYCPWPNEKDRARRGGDAADTVRVSLNLPTVRISRDGPVDIESRIRASCEDGGFRAIPAGRLRHALRARKGLSRVVK